ncbi:MAG: cation diffusion facilitator family transporter [Actinobacteria bacterium]|nr:cation diffusion facilitator family transporter [Actinomycetota bacterium]
MAGGSTRAIVAAMVANGGIAVAKFVAFGVTGSASMLAEGIHSVADTSNQGLLLLGGRRAKREATPAHPFGYGRERYFWSFVVALVLFTLGGLFALYEGWEKIRHPHEVTSVGWAVGVLVFAIVIESLSFRIAIQESNTVRGDRTWSQFIRTAKTPELPVVLLEDAGAMFGLVLALFGVTMTLVTGEPVWDGIGTLAIGVLLVIIAAILTIEMKSLLLGESAGPEDRAGIVGALEASPGVVRIIHLRTQHLGPEELLVGAKVELEPGLSFRAVCDVIDAAETRMREAVPAARVIYLEPDVFDDGHVGAPDRLDH